ncbi:MAG: hypothetical protein HY698_16495 [Deltaproteobacteria bacterium]|nr:hypothetical protein [Deltaproteobacteria bacterium]
MSQHLASPRRIRVTRVLFGEQRDLPDSSPCMPLPPDLDLKIGGGALVRDRWLEFMGTDGAVHVQPARFGKLSDAAPGAEVLVDAAHDAADPDEARLLWHVKVMGPVPTPR